MLEGQFDPYIEINLLSNMCYNLLVFHLDEIHKNVKPDDNVDRHDTSHGMKTSLCIVDMMFCWHSRIFGLTYIYPEEVCNAIYYAISV